MRKTFLRTFAITAVIIFCVALFGFGITASYKAINETRFAKYDKVIEIDKDTIRVFDYKIKNPIGKIF